MQSVPITTNVMSFNPTQYNIISVFPKNRQQAKLPGSSTFLVSSNHKFYIEMYLEIQVWPVQSCLWPLTMKIRENTALCNKVCLWLAAGQWFSSWKCDFLHQWNWQTRYNNWNIVESVIMRDTYNVYQFHLMSPEDISENFGKFHHCKNLKF